MTEVRCFFRLDYERKAKKEAAISHFRWVKELGNSSFSEYAISMAELDRLEGK
jgi:hypothetical protein